MAKTKSVSERNKLYVRVVPHSGWSNYYGWLNCHAGGTIEFKGTTLGYREDILKILRRMVRAEAEPPEVVVRTARLLHEHIEAYLRHIDVMGDDLIGTAVDYVDPETPYRSFTLRMEVSTKQVDVMGLVASGGGEHLGPAVSGWLTAIVAEFKGYDGSDGNGRHMVRRKLVFKGRIDSEVVWRELLATVRRAVNALPTE
jgi:hypothetical protein